MQLINVEDCGNHSALAIDLAQFATENLFIHNDFINYL